MIDVTYRVAFFGHRSFTDFGLLDDKLYTLLKDLIRTRSYVELYVGREGEFDIYASTVIKRVQNGLGKSNNEFICVLPYSKKDMEYYEEYYDRVMIPEVIGKAHPKGAITKRNRWMVDQADLIICYVEREEGGAYSALKYAKRLNKLIINLAKLSD